MNITSYCFDRIHYYDSIPFTSQTRWSWEGMVCTHVKPDSIRRLHQWIFVAIFQWARKNPYFILQKVTQYFALISIRLNGIRLPQCTLLLACSSILFCVKISLTTMSTLQLWLIVNNWHCIFGQCVRFIVHVAHGLRVPINEKKKNSPRLMRPFAINLHQ